MNSFAENDNELFVEAIRSAWAEITADGYRSRVSWYSLYFETIVSFALCLTLSFESEAF